MHAHTHTQLHTTLHAPTNNTFTDAGKHTAEETYSQNWPPLSCNKNYIFVIALEGLIQHE